jgi:hypothetical protein
LKIPLHIKLTSWLGIVAIAVQLNAVPFSLLLFHINQENIARTQCEHIMPHCNGHCYLMKQLAKTNGNDNDKKTERTGPQLDGQYLISSKNNLSLLACNDNSKMVLSNNDSVLPGWPFSLLQPPRYC